MCFSASASFVSSACIASMGYLANKRVRYKNERPLALIPVLFACQQFIEGLIWLCFKFPQYSHYLSFLTVLFLFFAWIVWPLLVPWSALQIESNQKKKRWIIFSLALGILLAFISMLQLVLFHPEAYIAGARIAYRIQNSYNIRLLNWLVPFMYVVSTLFPLLVSSIRGLILLGVTNLVALGVSFLFFNEALPSVWCFFAALLSLMIVKIIPIRTSQ